MAVSDCLNGLIRDGTALADIQEVLDLGVPLDAQDSTGMTPMGAAAESGREDIVEELEARGARVDVKDNCSNFNGYRLKEGSRPIERAAEGGHARVVAQLRRLGGGVAGALSWSVGLGGSVAVLAELPDPVGWAAVKQGAARGGHVGMLEAVVARGHTVLPAVLSLAAAEEGHVAVLRWLAERGAPIQTNCSFHAIYCRGERAVPWLIERGFPFRDLPFPLSQPFDRELWDAMARHRFSPLQSNLGLVRDVAGVEWLLDRGEISSGTTQCTIHHIRGRGATPASVRRLRDTGAHLRELHITDDSPLCEVLCTRGVGSTSIPIHAFNWPHPARIHAR